MLRVTCSSAEVSDAAKFSPSPIPSSSGAPMRATTSFSFSTELMTAMA